MKAALDMWSNTRLLILAAVVAAIYAAAQIALAPFSLVLIPGVLIFKISNILSMLLGVLFGPAGAWGLGIGNTIGDFFTGSLALGSVFGFLSSFSVGFVGYTFWGQFMEASKSGRVAGGRIVAVAVYLAIGVVAAVVSAVLLAWGLALLGIAPFPIVSNTLVLNFTIGSWVGGLLYVLVFPRLKSMGMLWTQMLSPSSSYKPTNFGAGALLMTVGSVAGWILGAFVLSASLVTPVVGVCVLCILVGAALL